MVGEIIPESRATSLGIRTLEAQPASAMAVDGVTFPRCGPAKTIYNRYHRWSQRRIWQRAFAMMAAIRHHANAAPPPKTTRRTSSKTRP